MNSKTVVGFAILVLAGVVAPYTGAYPIFLMKALCFALFACAFNLLLGFTGLLSFGTRRLRHRGLCRRHKSQGVGFAPEFGILFAVATPHCWVGWWAAWPYAARGSISP
jgi:branched-chain amino acid transport system permease protein